MIKVVLKGGLGNQMFQYACGKNLALETNQELILDTTFLKSRLPVPGFTFRDYELDLFGVKEPVVSLTKDPFVSKYLACPAYRLLKKVRKGGYIAEPFDKQYTYSPELFVFDKGNLTIEGYWTNYRYFEKHEEEIREIFNPAKLYDERHSEIEKRVTDSNSVAINIRRGDYLNNVNARFFTYLSDAYYKTAVDIIRNKVEKPKFFVFSYDDPEWIKSVLDFQTNELVIVGREYAGDRFKTYLRLMALCKHNIISNSTFAFWGAWLNGNYHKTVVCPAVWVRGKAFELPKGWTEIAVL